MFPNVAIKLGVATSCTETHLGDTKFIIACLWHPQNEVCRTDLVWKVLAETNDILFCVQLTMMYEDCTINNMRMVVMIRGDNADLLDLIMVEDSKG